MVVTASVGHLKKYSRIIFTPPLAKKKWNALEKLGMLFALFPLTHSQYSEAAYFFKMLFGVLDDEWQRSAVLEPLPSA